MTLQFKEVAYESIDALALPEHARLHAMNRRAEVPVLVDGDVTVVDSVDIVAYLEDRFPTPALLPSSPALRATTRRWQRVADTTLDAIIHDISLLDVAHAPSIRRAADGVGRGGATGLGDRARGTRQRARLERLRLRHPVDRGSGALPARLVAEGPRRSDGVVPERAPLEREHAHAAV